VAHSTAYAHGVLRSNTHVWAAPDRQLYCSDFALSPISHGGRWLQIPTAEAEGRRECGCGRARRPAALRTRQEVGGRIAAAGDLRRVSAIPKDLIPTGCIVLYKTKNTAFASVLSAHAL
jgi:hypothetical protein